VIHTAYIEHSDDLGGIQDTTNKGVNATVGACVGTGVTYLDVLHMSPKRAITEMTEIIRILRDVTSSGTIPDERDEKDHEAGVPPRTCRMRVCHLYRTLYCICMHNYNSAARRPFNYHYSGSSSSIWELGQQSVGISLGTPREGSARLDM
jgi:hypothetical protein